MSVCAVCQGIGEEDHPRGCHFEWLDWVEHPLQGEQPKWETNYGYAYGHYPNLVLLRESMRNGCRVCAFLLRVLKKQIGSYFDKTWASAAESERRRICPFDSERDTVETACLLKQMKDKAPSEWKSSFSYLNHVLGGWNRIVLLLYDMDFSPIILRREEQSFLFITIPAVPNEESQGINHISTLADSLEPSLLSSPAQDLLSEPHLELVRRWMETCSTKHEKCQTHIKGGRAQKMPTRMLEVSSNSVTGELAGARLIETKDSQGDYACLSYCWGQTPQKYVTTKSNLAQHLGSITLHSLPETIIDSLKFCCKLGFRYVWVDSLCIIQDDDDDWLRESSTMAEVYSNSRLTLANHLCGDSSESFLRKRQHPADPSLSGARLAYTDTSSAEERISIFWSREMDDARFLQGFDGWESLARYNRGSYWLGRAWVLQEWLLSPRVLHIHDMTQWDCFEGYGNELEQRSLQPTPIPRAFLGPGTGISWRVLVTEFTKRKITRDMDRLPALAGLAKRYRDITGHKYLAGIWLEDFPGDLLWQREKEYLTTPTTYRAPSWSWASLEGPIHFRKGYEYQAMESVTSIKSAHCEFYSPGHLASVKGGWLCVEGPICLVAKWANESDGNRYSILLEVDGDGREEPWLGLLDQDTCLRGYIARSEVYILSIATVYGFGQGLILLKTERIDGMDTFRRLGIIFTPWVWAQYGLWKRETIRLI